MTTTLAHTTSRDPVAPTRRSPLWLAVAFTLGGALGTGATAVAMDDGSGPRAVRPASVTSDGAGHCLASQEPDRYAAMTPGAAEQWALAEREARYASMTPDAAEQWALAERAAGC